MGGGFAEKIDGQRTKMGNSVQLWEKDIWPKTASLYDLELQYEFITVNGFQTAILGGA